MYIKLLQSSLQIYYHCFFNIFFLYDKKKLKDNNRYIFSLKWSKWEYIPGICLIFEQNKVTDIFRVYMLVVSSVYQKRLNGSSIYS
jgi:hypothetical protein